MFYVFYSAFEIVFEHSVSEYEHKHFTNIDFFFSPGSTSSDTNGDSVCLDETSSVKFSVWVSFCEIYNENIHDLLDVVPNGSHRRNVLRLSQDVKGNAFVKGNQLFSGLKIIISE